MLRTSVRALAFLLLAGCNCSGGLLNMCDEWCQKHTAAQSSDSAELSHTLDWNQENLKRNDSGCPTAIYVNQNGVLALCPPN